MQKFRTNLQKLLLGGGVLVLFAMMNTFITAAIAGGIMLELESKYPGTIWPLVAALIAAVVIYLWIAYNHKLRIYIEEQGNTNE